ncbi:MAG: tRNA 4-thiouridine(8) synthase ThiI [Desulfobacterales bacterium RIFOXYA12_FULL_46_15]|nr:MAG: tRNA 4-thiouridine(8) synthase ThiI [Desulfobacula sp. GWF2_41_7]OGR27395.1 MAG: tRNA 4-thiouridine(8) synthase ThiI [Desulfobacterales bacterium RIFOXYA12_FULL_46_15]
MKIEKTSSPVKGLGLCSGGLDSMLSALLLQQQGIAVTLISFETPFFSSESAKKASLQTGIPLFIHNITDDYMEMMKKPNAGFGKNMNPCMDCHALMFSKAGEVLKNEGFDFLFSGEVVGQRPKSQNKNSLRYVEKNSGFEGKILRPLSAKLLPATEMEKKGLVNRETLMDISGRSRKTQFRMAKEFGIKEYPSPAGGCLLTDKIFSSRLMDLMDVQISFNNRELYLLKYGRHFRMDSRTKVIVGRSQQDNEFLMEYYQQHTDILLKHNTLPGPDVILTGTASPANIETAALICAAYTKSPEEEAPIRIMENGGSRIITVSKEKIEQFKKFMI